MTSLTFFRFFRLHCNREVCYTEITEAVTRYSIHNGALAQLGVHVGRKHYPKKQLNE